MAASCEKREYLQSDPDVLTSRQIEILEENSLPTDMDKPDFIQETDIKKFKVNSYILAGRIRELNSSI